MKITGKVFSRSVLEPQQKQEIRAAMKAWYADNRRELPWRESSDPYLIWLSEIILQQTRVEQGTPYFEAFRSRFPSVELLARAEEDEVLRLWQGLGYYSRARNLQQAARQVVGEFDGQFPSTYTDLITLKGVGPYTAAAIASIAFGQPHAVVDGNVIRVVSRLFGMDGDVRSTSVQREISNIAGELLEEDHPGAWNQAMMDFGAMQCVPKKPACEVCSLRSTCQAHQTRRVDQIPFKSKSTKRRSRFFHFFIVTDGAETWLEKRGVDDIWRGLYQFPMIESKEETILELAVLLKALNIDQGELQRIRKAPKHVLSHQDLFATFYHIELDSLPKSSFVRVVLSELSTFALPRLIDRYLESHPVVDSTAPNGLGLGKK